MVTERNKKSTKKHQISNRKIT